MLPDILLDKLRQAQEEHRMVAYHLYDDNPSIFLVGFIQAIHETRIVFDEIGTSGRPEDLNQSVDIADIVWFDFDTDYLRGLEALYPIYEELIGMKPTAGIKATKRNAIEEGLKIAARSGEAVLIEIDEDKIDAIVKEVAGDFVAFIQLRDGGRADGICWARIDVIKRLDRKTDRQIADRFLYERRLPER